MTFGLVAATIVLALGHLGRPARLRHEHRPPQRARRRNRLPDPEEWARWLETVTAHVRAGSSLTVAVDAAHQHHGLHGRRLMPGAGLAAVTTARPDDPHEAVVVHVLAVSTALGGSVAATLQSGAALLRERAGVAAEARAHAAQARLSARVLTAVPLVFAGWNVVASPRFRAAVGTPVGAVTTMLGLLLSAAGWWWMRHIVDRAAR